MAVMMVVCVAAAAVQLRTVDGQACTVCSSVVYTVLVTSGTSSVSLYAWRRKSRPWRGLADTPLAARAAARARGSGMSIVGEAQEGRLGRRSLEKKVCRVREAFRAGRAVNFVSFAPVLRIERKREKEVPKLAKEGQELQRKKSVRGLCWRGPREKEGPREHEKARG